MLDLFTWIQHGSIFNFLNPQSKLKTFRCKPCSLLTFQHISLSNIRETSGVCCMSETQLTVTFLRNPAAVCQSIHQRQLQKGLFKAAGKNGSSPIMSICFDVLISIKNTVQGFFCGGNRLGILMRENENINNDLNCIFNFGFQITSRIFFFILFYNIVHPKTSLKVECKIRRIKSV